MDDESSVAPLDGDHSPHARGKRPKKADRVRLIRSLMATGRWITGVTGRELARSWGLHYDSVKRESAEASRSISEEIDPEIRSQLIATLQSVAATAQQKGQLRTVIEAVRVLVEIVNRDAPGDETEPTHPTAVTITVSRLPAPTAPSEGSGDASPSEG